MIDPLAEVVSLLRPTARLTKVVRSSGRWRILRSHLSEPFYAALLEGRCSLSVNDAPPMHLQAGDFVLLPAGATLTMTSAEPPPEGEVTVPVQLEDRTVCVGDPGQPHDVLTMAGHCAFEAPDAALLVSLLPRVIHVHADTRLQLLVKLVGDEWRHQRPARDVVMARLLEVMFIEAMRSGTGVAMPPGMLRGLADERLAIAIRCMHEDPANAWTVVQLAKASALSRSAFFERFNRAVGIAPMEYLLTWRMALARRLLAADGVRIAEVAQRVGYSSASSFSVAFTRHTGQPPTQFARANASEPDERLGVPDIMEDSAASADA